MRSEEPAERLHARVADTLPLPATVLFGLQQTSVSISGVVSGALVVAALLCVEPTAAGGTAAAGAHAAAATRIVASMLVCCGLATVAQCTWGVRLPVLQGPSFSFLPAIILLTKTGVWTCGGGAGAAPNATLSNHTGAGALEQLDHHADIAMKMQVLQGSLMAAACVQVLIGATGAIGLLASCIGPLTIAPLMLLLEVSITEIVLQYASKHWASVVLCALIVTLAFVIDRVEVPVPYYTRGKGCTANRAPVFALFPYLISICIVWGVCFILSAMDIISHESPLSTHATGKTLAQTDWFLLPYPGQWGAPTFHTGVFLGFIAGTVSSVIESVGDYHALARTCQCAPPPAHAVSRGILMEGLGCMLCGLVGVGIGVTSYSENVGVVGITRVASRAVMQAAGGILVLLGVFAKFGALLASIPQPLMGGILAVGCAQVAGVGLSAIHIADMRLSRNAFVLGFSILVGIILPQYISQSPIDTGVEHLDQALNMLLQVNMFVAGFVGCLLDNTMPGATRLQRGLDQYKVNAALAPGADDDETAEVDPYTWHGAFANSLLPKVAMLPFMPRGQKHGASILRETTSV